MRDACNEDEARGIIDGVHDAVIAHTDPIVVPTGEPHAADRARIRRQSVDVVKSDVYAARRPGTK